MKRSAPFPARRRRHLGRLRRARPRARGPARAPSPRIAPARRVPTHRRCTSACSSTPRSTGPATSRSASCSQRAWGSWRPRSVGRGRACSPGSRSASRRSASSRRSRATSSFAPLRRGRVRGRAHGPPRARDAGQIAPRGASCRGQTCAEPSPQGTGVPRLARGGVRRGTPMIGASAPAWPRRRPRCARSLQRDAGARGPASAKPSRYISSTESSQPSETRCTAPAGAASCRVHEPSSSRRWTSTSFCR